MLGGTGAGKTSLVRALAGCTASVLEAGCAAEAAALSVETSMLLAATVGGRPVLLHVWDVPFAVLTALEDGGPSLHGDLIFSGAHAVVVAFNAAPAPLPAAAAAASGDDGGGRPPALTAAYVEAAAAPLDAMDACVAALRRRLPAVAAAPSAPRAARFPLYLLAHGADGVAWAAAAQAAAEAADAPLPPALLAALAAPAPPAPGGGAYACKLDAADLAEYADAAGFRSWFWTSLWDGPLCPPPAPAPAPAAAPAAKQAKAAPRAAAAAAAAAALSAPPAADAPLSDAHRAALVVAGGVLAQRTGGRAALINVAAQPRGAVPPGSGRPSTSTTRFLAHLVADALEHWGLLPPLPGAPPPARAAPYCAPAVAALAAGADALVAERVF